jgi:hypothetical protein
MIDHGIFLAGMATLAGCYGRELDQVTLRAYHQVLSARLTTEEFERAVQATIGTETFWPSPAVLVAKVKAQTPAAAAFARLVDQLRQHGGYRFFPHSAYQELDEPTKAGIRAAGGLAAIDQRTDRTAASVEREFAKAYTAKLAELEAALVPPANAPRELAGVAGGTYGE